jgi:hypothetical protein
MKKKSKKIRLNGTDAGAKWDKILLWNGWIIFIKRHTGEKEISFSFRSAVFSFIIWSISGDNTKKVKMSFFFDIFSLFLSIFVCYHAKHLVLFYPVKYVPFNPDPTIVK